MPQHPTIISKVASRDWVHDSSSEANARKLITQYICWHWPWLWLCDPYMHNIIINLSVVQSLLNIVHLYCICLNCSIHKFINFVATDCMHMYGSSLARQTSTVTQPLTASRCAQREPLLRGPIQTLTPHLLIMVQRWPSSLVMYCFLGRFWRIRLLILFPGRVQCTG